jgi:hypothetical protein
MTEGFAVFTQAPPRDDKGFRTSTSVGIFSLISRGTQFSWMFLFFYSLLFSVVKNQLMKLHLSLKPNKIALHLAITTLNSPFVEENEQMIMKAAMHQAFFLDKECTL